MKQFNKVNRQLHEIVIYPNNSASVDGRLLTRDETIMVLQTHGISNLRLDGDLVFRRGDTVFRIFSDPLLKNMDQVSNALERLTKKYNAVKSLQKMQANSIKAIRLGLNSIIEGNHLNRSKPKGTSRTR